jgi:hypothetical protein
MKRTTAVPTPQIRMHLGQIVDAVPAMRSLESAAWPIQTAYQIGELCNKLDEKLKLWSDQRNKLVTKFGSERPSTQEEKAAGQPEKVTAVTPDNLAEFDRQMQALNATPVVLDMAPIEMKMAEMPADLRVAPRDLRMALAFFNVK